LFVNHSGTGTASIGAGLTGTGNAISANSANAANTFATIEASTNSNTPNNSAIIGVSSGASRGVTGLVQSTGTGEAGVFGNNLRTTLGSYGVMGTGFDGVFGLMVSLVIQFKGLVRVYMDIMKI